MICWGLRYCTAGEHIVLATICGQNDKFSSCNSSPSMPSCLYRTWFLIQVTILGFNFPCATWRSQIFLLCSVQKSRGLLPWWAASSYASSLLSPLRAWLGWHPLPMWNRRVCVAPGHICSMWARAQSSYLLGIGSIRVCSISSCSIDLRGSMGLLVINPDLSFRLHLNVFLCLKIALKTVFLFKNVFIIFFRVSISRRVYLV